LSTAGTPVAASGAARPAHVIPRLVIAGAASNVGKTTVAAGLAAALRARGLVVQTFKCGPDYIDPSYHQRASGRLCRNIDAWMLSPEQLPASFARACAGADIALVEGVMGLFDGSDWCDERGSTAHIAKLLRAPVLLVLDIAGAARSAAITVLGCRQFDAQVDIRAVALNFAGSPGHAAGCGEAVRELTGAPCVGWLPRQSALRIPERHLGLVPGGEHEQTDALIAQLATEVSAHFDLDAIVAMASRVPPLPPGQRAPALASPASSDAPVLAVARDQAFCFYYPENLELLEDAGARIEFFSPLQGERPSERAAGVYLGGGYPELHGPALAANTGCWDRIRQLHRADAPIFAECGGFMALTQGLIDREGRHWPMAGLVPGAVRMTDRLAAIGYHHAVAIRANLLADAGESLRAHEFRYSRWECPQPGEAHAAWQATGTRPGAAGEPVGYARGNLLASYLHFHFAQREQLAARFVARLWDYLGTSLQPATTR